MPPNGIARHLARAVGLALLLVVGGAPSVAQDGRPPSAAQADDVDAILESPAARLMEELMWGRETIGGPFRLTDHTGERRSDRDFRGRLVLLYFGFTFCPDVCPTDLWSMSEAVRDLGEDGDEVELLFVTLDPGRDTVDHLSGYVPLFHPRLIGLTGSDEEIAAVADAYRVYYSKARLCDGDDDYTVDHSAFIYLLDRDGSYVGFFPPMTSPDRIAEIVRLRLER